MPELKIFFRHVLLTLALASSAVGTTAQALSIAVDAPGCTTGGLLAWDGATKTVYCLGGPTPAPDSLTITLPDCASGTTLVWNGATQAITCQVADGPTTPAAAVQVTFNLPNCVAGAVTWSAATNTLTCPPSGPPASIAVWSGSGQAAVVDTPFDNSLVVIVRDAADKPLAGIDVAFHVPETGTGADVASATAVTDADGIASASASANAVPGAYMVSASVAGVAGAALFELFNTAAVAPPPRTLNIDKSTDPVYDPLTDGLLVLRYMFGQRDEALTAGALSATALRNDPVAIATHLDSMASSLDIDDNRSIDALTDGILVLRYMFGIRGAALIGGAVGPDAGAATAEAIEARIQDLMP